MKHLIVIGGATASGKTNLAIQLARHFNIEIISADSRQFFREMSIGTAKPSQQELAMAPHHFIDHLSVAQNYSVGDFEREALTCLEQLYQQQDAAILVGGSGLYLKAVCEGMDTFPEVSQAVKEQVQEGAKQGGIEWLQQQLAEKDPEYYRIVDRQNPARLRRALEVSISSGAPYSSFRNRATIPRQFQPVYLLLDLPRATLYERINLRVDEMIRSGLEAEVRKLIPYKEHPALKTVGYEEFFEYFDGKISYETAIDKIKQHSRNYAKRQDTWFRKHGDWQRFAPENLTDIVAYLESIFQQQ